MSNEVTTNVAFLDSPGIPVSFWQIKMMTMVWRLGWCNIRHSCSSYAAPLRIGVKHILNELRIQILEFVW